MNEFMRQALMRLTQANTPTPPVSSSGWGPNGMRVPGNIDVNHRPIIKNDDGSVSTIYSTTVPTGDGRWALIPTIANGQFFTPNGKKPNDRNKKEMGALEDRAYEYYQKTGQHLGIFDTAQSADDYANATHAKIASGTAEKVFVADRIPK